MKKKKRFCILFSCLIIIVLVAAVPAFIGIISKSLYPEKYRDTVHKISKAENISPYLVFAVMKAESGFNKDAVSVKNAYGLMQITGETMEWLRSKYPGEFGDITLTNIRNPEKNIALGIRFLRLNMEKYKNLPAVLAAYNAGMGRVDGWLSDSRYSSDGETLNKIPFEETDNYVIKVTKYYSKYLKIYEKDN